MTLESPELYAAALAGERAGLAVAVAQKEYKPDFSVQAGYMNRGGLEPMWLAGVGLKLPVHRKRLASGLAEAEAQARASARLADSLRLQLRFRTEERMAQLAATEKLVALYGKGIVPQDLLSVDAAVANYQTGKVPFISVLEALTTLYNDRAAHLGAAREPRADPREPRGGEPRGDLRAWAGPARRGWRDARAPA